MIRVRLSTKGQLVIPSQVRRRLSLRPGDTLELDVVDDTVVLRLSEHESPIDALHGRFAGVDLVGELESDHAEELRGEL